MWEAQDLGGIPVKIQSHIGDITLSATYRNIVVGNEDQNLFTAPQVCTPFEKMGEVAEQKTIQ